MATEQGLTASQLRDLEQWELEQWELKQAKLTAPKAGPELTVKIAIVSGAAVVLAWLVRSYSMKKGR